MNTNIGISQPHLQAVAAELSKLLADEFVLYTKTRNAHWNVEGPDFHSMHTFFESQYEALDETMDSVAERIRQLGHFAPATLKSFLSLTHLTEKLGEKNDSQGFIKELLIDHETVKYTNYPNEFTYIDIRDSWRCLRIVYPRRVHKVA